MNRKILALLLSAAMLLALFVVPATAHDATYDSSITLYATPAGAEEANAAALKMTTNTSANVNDYASRIISIGLTASTLVKSNLTNDEKAQVGDINQGFSMIGVKTTQKVRDANPTSGLQSYVDGKWMTDVKTFFTGSLYNVNGEELVGAKAENDGYRYTSLYTFNFGKKMAIESFGFVAASNNNIPQAADIYVSNDGTNWTLAGYYDRLHDRAGFDGCSDFGFISITSVFPDVEDSYYNNGRLYIFDLPETQVARYLRIAVTTLATGVNNSTFKKATATDPYVPGQGAGTASNSIIDLRQFLVFGEDAIRLDSYQTKKVAGAESYDVRFAATLEQEMIVNAAKITFTVSASYTDTSNPSPVEVAAKDFDTATVYEKILAAGNPVDAPEGCFYALFDLTDIPNDVDVTFSVTPKIVYNDATTYVGKTVEVSLS